MILLINPPFLRLKGKRDDSVPNGLAWLSAYLQTRGVKSVIYNADMGHHGKKSRAYRKILGGYAEYLENLKNPQHESWAEIRAVLQDIRPDWVGVSVMSAKSESAAIVSRIVKEVCPRCRVIWGGQHPTILPHLCLARPEVDFVVRGEGEGPLAALLTRLDADGRPDTIPGIGYKRGGRPILTGPADRPDFASLPFPRKDNLLFPERYDRNDLGGITATRGCPFPCGFCSARQVVGKKIRYRPVESVADEIEYLKRTFGTGVFHFHDDTFTANREYTEALCSELIARRTGVSWSCTTRLKSLSADLLRQMERAGCYYTSVGVESGSNRVLGQMKKNIMREDVIERIAVLKRANVAWAVYIMAGLPEETAEDVDLTADLIRRIKPERVVLSFFTPYPGTALFDRCVELGLVSKTMDWSHYNHQSPHNDFCLAAGKPDYREALARLVATVDRNNSSARGKMRRLMRTLPLIARRPALGIAKLRRALAR
ncbi:MAG TPA: radical SAM protein [Thermoguttaceae bacterium]|nr:radical SAM protein [Thermoguttaceae bacterium]